MHTATAPSLRIRLATRAKIWRAQRSLSVVGNSLGLKTNSRYFFHHLLCKLRSKNLRNNPQAEILAQALKKNGAVKLSQKLDVADLAKKVKTYFDLHPPENGNALMDKESASTFSNEVHKLLHGEIQDILQAHYGSHFQIYWITLMHYGRVPNETAASSFGWHIDDNPRELLKVFIYLNDTYESNAAFRAFDYETTKDLLAQGFISNTAELRVASQHFITTDLIKNKLKVFEGAQGTTLIFDNNLIHKGTAPREGYRNVVCVEVYPGDRPPSLKDVENGLKTPIKTDYPLDPFFNDITRG